MHTSTLHKPKATLAATRSFSHLINVLEFP